MARLFRSRIRTKTMRLAAGATTLSVAAVVMLATVSSGTAYADTVLPGGLGSYNLSASSSGLYLAIAGTQLTGGTSSVSGTYNLTAGGAAPAETASASGQGFLLSSALTGTGPSVSVTSASGPTTASGTEGPDGDSASNGGTGGGDVDTDGPAVPDDCAQGGGQVSSGVGAFVGLGCGYASASIDPAGASALGGPQALGAGNIATVSVDLAGILDQLYSSGASSLCSALGNIPELGTGLLQPACTQILTGTPTDSVTGLVNPTVQVNVGNAYSEIVGTATEVYSKSVSSSVDVSVFPGIDSGLEPLLRVQIPAATAESCEGGPCTPVGPAACTTSSGGWTNSYNSSLIQISGTLIDALNVLSSGALGSALDIPPCGSGTSQLAALAGPGVGPLCTNGLLCLTLSSATTSGSGVSGSGLDLSLLPGKAPGGSDVVDLNTAGVQTSNGATAATAATSPATATSPTTLPAVPVVAAESPTAVHTGEWWAGSLPLLGVLAALGGGLIGWPRLRRMPLVARLVSRGSR